MEYFLGRNDICSFCGPPDIFLSVETGEGQVVQLSLKQVYQLAQWLAGREADEDAGLLERVEGGAGPRHQA